MNIRNTFLALTKKTYPHGFEDKLVGFLPRGHYKDTHGNYFYKIGESKTAFTCHLDTACKEQVNVIHKFEGNIIRTDGKSILGADDKAGLTVLLYMIEKNVPGLYCFFIGEEVGCIGSGLASKDANFKEYDRMISFDRRGTESIITFQSSTRCCSDIFAKALAEEFNKFELNMKPDDTGVYTDSAEFTGVIPECTNISVGYYREHTHEENQDISHLIKLCNASVKVNWDSLPTKRDTKVSEYKKYSGYSGYSGSQNLPGSYYRDSYGYSTRTRGSYGHSTRDIKNSYGYNDDWYDRDDRWTPYFEDKSKSSSKSFYPNELDDIDSFYESVNKNHYEALKQLIFDDRLTASEFEMVRDQYLDMENWDDIAFYNEMILALNGL